MFAQKFQQFVERVLNDPNRLKVTYDFWGIEAQYYIPLVAPEDADVVDRDKPSSTAYDLDNPQGSIRGILMELYEWGDVRRYTRTPLPEGEYEMYVQSLPDDFHTTSLLQFSFEKIARDRVFYHRVKDVSKIEGIRYEVARKLILEPYRWGNHYDAP